MIATIVVSALTIVTNLILLIFKPTFTVKGKTINFYWIIPLIGAILLLSVGSISPADTWAGLTSNTSVNPLKLLVIFFGMTFLSVFLDEMGLFQYLASFAVTKAKSSQKSLFFVLYVTVSLLTAFTSNDIVILTFTPFILHFAKRANISPLPYLIAEFVAANTLSMTLIIGNPTNIYIATSVGVDFVTYLKIMILPSIASALVAFGILRIIFHKQLSQPLTVEQSHIELQDKVLLIVGIVHLVVAIVLLSICSYIGIEMYLVCAVLAGSLLIFSFVYSLVKKQGLSLHFRVFKRLPYALAPFVLSMFVMVLALHNCGLTEIFAKALSGGDSVFVYGLTSFLASNIFNNIPMSVLFSDIIATSTLAGKSLIGATYASIIGSNIGAYLSPVGALAGIMWLSILKKHGHPISFVQFMKYGVLISIPVMLVALSVLHLSMLYA